MLLRSPWDPVSNEDVQKLRTLKHLICVIGSHKKILTMVKSGDAGGMDTYQVPKAYQKQCWQKQ